MPVALATDDPGVSRDDMTNQYMRAVQEQGLDYATLKRLARNSLEYSFAEGESLWIESRLFEDERRVRGCGIVRVQDVPRGEHESAHRMAAGAAAARLRSEVEAEFSTTESRTEGLCRSSVPLWFKPS